MSPEITYPCLNFNVATGTFKIKGARGRVMDSIKTTCRNPEHCPQVCIQRTLSISKKSDLSIWKNQRHHLKVRCPYMKHLGTESIGCFVFVRKHPVLTHPTLDKMAIILADDIFNCIFLNENDRILIQISLKYVSSSPTDNKPALLLVMAWRRRGDKPLPWRMMTHFIDAYM